MLAPRDTTVCLRLTHPQEDDDFSEAEAGESSESPGKRKVGAKMIQEYVFSSLKMSLF